LAVIAAWYIPALREKVELFHLANHEQRVAVLPFDIAENNADADARACRAACAERMRAAVLRARDIAD
jgi:hypothetical protein